MSERSRVLGLDCRGSGKVATTYYNLSCSMSSVEINSVISASKQIVPIFDYEFDDVEGQKFGKCLTAGTGTPSQRSDNTK